MLNARYEARLPLFATTNCSPEELTERLIARVMDRLRETCLVIEIRGASLRGR